MFERMIFVADNLAAIEVGGGLGMVEAAAFDQDDPAPAGEQPSRRGLAGRTRPDNRDVGSDRFRRFPGTIDPH
jgi:hypothetical protein